MDADYPHHTAGPILREELYYLSDWSCQVICRISDLGIYDARERSIRTRFRSGTAAVYICCTPISACGTRDWVRKSNVIPVKPNPNLTVPAPPRGQSLLLEPSEPSRFLQAGWRNRYWFKSVRSGPRFLHLCLLFNSTGIVNARKQGASLIASYITMQFST